MAGPGHVVFFVLMAVARITDITTTDAAGRTSINATFKALPPRQRLAAQVGVEGAGVPVALGLTAAMILALNALPGESVTYVAAATLILSLASCGMTLVVYRRYRAAVVGSARRRTLDGEEMAPSEPTTRGALLDLLRPGDPRDAEVAMRLLSPGAEVDTLVRAAAESPSLEVQRAVAPRLGVVASALGASARRRRRALAQEAAAAGRQLVDLPGLIYDRQLHDDGSFRIRARR